MADEKLVVQGGQLIDGTGRPPIENAVIVIRGGRFQAVGRSGGSRHSRRCAGDRRQGQDRSARLYRRSWPPGGFPRRALSPSRHYDLRFNRHLPGRPMDSGAKAGNRSGENPRTADLDVRTGDRRRQHRARRTALESIPGPHHRHHAGRGVQSRAAEKRTRLRHPQGQ